MQAADAVGDADTKACLRKEILKRLLRSEEPQRALSLSSTLPSAIPGAHASITDQVSTASALLARLGARLPVVGNDVKELNLNHTNVKVAGAEVSSMEADAVEGRGGVIGTIPPYLVSRFVCVGPPMAVARLVSYEQVELYVHCCVPP